MCLPSFRVKYRRNEHPLHIPAENTTFHLFRATLYVKCLEGCPGEGWVVRPSFVRVLLNLTRTSHIIGLLKDSLVMRLSQFSKSHNLHWVHLIHMESEDDQSTLPFVQLSPLSRVPPLGGFLYQILSEFLFFFFFFFFFFFDECVDSLFCFVFFDLS